MKKLMLAMCAFSLIAGTAVPVSAAAPCRDTKGKFIKCPAAKAAKPAAKAAKPAAKAAKPKTCRDAKGKFTKCK
jgi:hypothetical protein